MLDSTTTPLQAVRSTQEIASRLLARLRAARGETDRLFALVRPDALYDRPIAERHRLVFYRGHLEAFDANLLRNTLIAARPFAPELDRLFAFGIDPVGTALPSDTPADWPRIDQIERYNGQVRSVIDIGLDRLAERIDSAGDTSGDDHPVQILNMAIEHRLMHAETLAYLLHRLPYERKRAAPQDEIHVASRPRESMVDIERGAVTLGRNRVDGGGFGWDNEFEAQTLDVPAFSIDRYMVTNAQYLRFVDAGGYDDRAHWTDADWQWKSGNDIAHPAFWTRGRDGWRWRGMFGEQPLPPDWPVYVSHAEASAYAAWAGKALPTESQWQRAATGLRTPGGSERGNYDFRRFDPAPVHAFPQQASAFGVEGLAGNGWEWTSSAFAPLPNFRPSPHYRGYSADFFDGRHFTLKGGSPRTAACMLRSTFRNWFQSHYPYVYAGFRCVSH